MSPFERAKFLFWKLGGEDRLRVLKRLGLPVKGGPLPQTAESALLARIRDSDRVGDLWDAIDYITIRSLRSVVRTADCRSADGSSTLLGTAHMEATR